MKKFVPHVQLHLPLQEDQKNHYHRKGYQYVKGCKVFYWLLTDPKDIYFKFGRCGLLPLETPLFVDIVENVHSVVNQSKKSRIIISIAGEFYNDK